jgi:hypothetical protein
MNYIVSRWCKAPGHFAIKDQFCAGVAACRRDKLADFGWLEFISYVLY